MAEIIKLGIVYDRSSQGTKTRNSSAPVGPAQILFFTGVRYERRQVEPEAQVEPETPAPKTANRSRAQSGKAVKS